MVRLQKRFAYTYKDKEHYKHVVTLPEKEIERLGWKEGQELELAVKNNELVLKPQRSAKNDRSR